MITIPNLMSLGRACVVPAFILLFNQGLWAIGLFVAAMITDALDGILARRTHTESTMGTILDPIADKLLLVSAVVMLGRRGDVPEWWMWLVLGRDLFIVGGWTLVYLVTRQIMMPTKLGKLANVSQTVTVILFLLPWTLGGLAGWCGWVMVACTLASWLEYGWRGSSQLWGWRSVRA